MIHFEHISIGYLTELFKIRDLAIEAGQVYGLVGANGAGKSTFLRSLLGLQPFLSGKILINKEVIDPKNGKLRARQFAFVESSFSGIEFLSVEEYILLGRTPYIGSVGRYSEKDREVLEETIRLFDLEKFRKLGTDKLSDGERQIAAIARAIAQETQVILLDEPTAFLDYGNKKRILELLMRVAKEKNLTVILSTHDIDLCLQEEQISILLIDRNEKELMRCSGSVSKEEILKNAFGYTDK
ncbi:MAG: ABC transporter ATP-binding protein [Flavobacteriia bacterium]|jgi:iron complex transport system ATP-binding protein